MAEFDLFRVTAGGACLNPFRDLDAAREFARGVVLNSHPNIGPVRIEGRDNWRGDWLSLGIVGVPGKPVNARFWVWHNGDWIKLTLKPGERLEAGEGGPTDEGYSNSVSSWELNDGIVSREFHSWGRDCDGFSEYHHQDECALDALTESEPGADEYFHNGKPIRTPAWSHAQRSCRDYSAESAGY